MSSLGTGVPAIIGFAYFLLNFVVTIFIGFHFYGQSAFNAMCNYFWKRRVVFASLTIYFLDTATDIVVAITWGQLMDDELSGRANYESIDMRTFFWPMIGFFLLYQVLLMFSNCDSKFKLDVLFSILQLYPFRALWVSLDESNAFGNTARMEEQQRSQKQQKVYGDAGQSDNVPDTEPANDAGVAPAENVVVEVTPMTDDEEDDQKKEVESPTPGGDEEAGHQIDNKMSLQTPTSESHPEMKPSHEQRSSVLVANAAIGELQDHDPTQAHRFMLILQCVFETVPGLLLQLTFWIKSSNDPILSGDKDTFLIPFSIAVSVITITDRFVRYVDDLYILDDYKRRICGSYIARTLFRMSSVVANFVVFSLIWTIVGGPVVAIWAGVSYILWLIAAAMVEKELGTAVMFGNGMRNMFAIPVFYDWKWHCIKFVQNIIGMVLIFIFFFVPDIDGDIFTSWDTREALSTHGRVQFLGAIGWISTLMSFALFMLLNHLDVVNDKAVLNDMWSRGTGHVTPRSSVTVKDIQSNQR